MEDASKTEGEEKKEDVPMTSEEEKPKE